jgi:glycerol-3-phosphate dehydrogenase (NAD(P)+)
MRVAVIGAGGWGTALALLAARAGHGVRLWSRGASVAEEVNRRRTNEAYLPGHELPEAVRATPDAGEAVGGAELVILAAPSHVTREVLGLLRGRSARGAVFVSATKGVEVETGLRISELVADVLGPEAASAFVCLSGPSFAQEVAAGQPAAVVAASADEARARLVQEALSVQNFRVYTNTDVVGAELGGASKNVMALAAGMVSGLGLGSNSVAALVTRGLPRVPRRGQVRGRRGADGHGGQERARRAGAAQGLLRRRA